MTPIMAVIPTPGNQRPAMSPTAARHLMTMSAHHQIGVIAYFCAAAAAHVRAHFLGSAFWINCLGMLAFSIGVLILTLALN